jgi:DNA-binding NtrC family response regulator
MRKRIEILIDEMLEGQILLDEALTEFKKIYIQKALERNGKHLSKTASALGIHRNTLSKHVCDLETPAERPRRLLKKRSNNGKASKAG